MAQPILKIYNHYDNDINVVGNGRGYIATGNVYLVDESIDDCYINFEFEADIEIDYEGDISDVHCKLHLIEMENLANDVLTKTAEFTASVEQWLTENCMKYIEQLRKESYEF